MLKKIAMFVLLSGIAGISNADQRFGIVNDFNIAFSTGDVVLPAQGTRERNCLEWLSSSSTATYTVRILNGNTTSYQLTRSGSSPVQEVFGGTPFCGSVNTTMTIRVTPTTDNGAAKEMNYFGYVGR